MVLYGCDIWYFTLREEHRLRAFENRVLRRKSGPKTDEGIRGWRKLLNKELYNLYSSSIIIMAETGTMRLAEHVARMGLKRNEFRLFVGKPEGKSHYEDQDINGRIIVRWILDGIG
jgi:hypothetical protein